MGCGLIHKNMNYVFSFMASFEMGHHVNDQAECMDIFGNKG